MNTDIRTKLSVLENIAKLFFPGMLSKIQINLTDMTAVVNFMF